MNRLNVLPSLFEERDQEVDSQEDVLSELVFSHLLVSNGNSHAGDFLQLELDVGTSIVDLVLERLSMGAHLREHTNTGKNGSEDLRDLLHEDISGQENVVLFGPLLDGFLLLVELLETFEIDGVDVETLCQLDVLGISDQTDLELGSGDVGQSDGASKSLVFLGVVVLESDLEFDGFLELSLLLISEDGGDALGDLGLGES